MTPAVRKLAAYALIILGAACLVWFCVVAGSFTFIAARGFIGTEGREAGGELLIALAALGLGSSTGLMLMRSGARLLQRQRAGDS